MNSFTQMLWKKAVSYLGAAQSLVRPVAKQFKIASDEGDIHMLRKLALEGLEACDAERAIYIAMLADTEDGTLDLAELAELAVLLETAVDEREDMITGHDEDDEAPGEDEPPAE